MNSDTLSSALTLLGFVSAFGLLGTLVGRDVDHNSRHGRDNWHRPGGYPLQPSPGDRLLGTLPAASDPAPGKLSEWTSSSARPSSRTSQQSAPSLTRLSSVTATARPTVRTPLSS
ncbi:hypothetical protein F4556_002567 [Kitasatospora gansuensis]|uniref:Uncharacterized protein n=1 Tax=Kitasatospora gansuensis TaxID=258050 RepID=A0A7W7SBI4_9ACTN|nr:hypothetical protein [Kitasatospora gansuensis]MBB4947032.1 hypothetical protein [Kitasatospora gansuensis]